MLIKDLIKQKRIEKKLTMKELADKVGVSEASISRWESGEISNMKHKGIISLSNALGIEPNDLMGWEKDYNSDIDTNYKTLKNDEIKLLNYYNSSNKLGKERILTNSKEMAVLYPITTRDEILQFFEDKKIAAYGGMNLNSMSDEELIDLYNDIKGTLK